MGTYTRTRREVKNRITPADAETRGYGTLAARKKWNCMSSRGERGLCSFWGTRRGGGEGKPG